MQVAASVIFNRMKSAEKVRLIMANEGSVAHYAYGLYANELDLLGVPDAEKFSVMKEVRRLAEVEYTARSAESVF